MATTPRSRKNKGKRLQNEVVQILYENYPMLEEGDLRSTIMGDSGTDVKMSPAAKRLIPFDIECKNQETASIWQWLTQAEENSEEKRIPLVVFKRNRSKTYAVLEFDKLMELLSDK